MNPHTDKRQMEALEKFLRGEVDIHDPEVPVEEAILAGQLRDAAGQLQPDPDFTGALARQLSEARSARPAWNHILRGWWPSLAGAAGLALLALLIIWVVRSLAPAPVLPAATGEPTAPIQPTGTPYVTVTDATGYYAPLFGETYALKARFPDSPASASLYEQTRPEATLEHARLLAEKFGIQGGIFTLPEAWTPGKNSYLVTDGKQRLYIYNQSQYDYYADYIHNGEQFQPEEDNEKLQAVAEAYLQEHGLLDFPYQVEFPAGLPGEIHFVPTLDGYPIRYALMHTSPYLGAVVSASGEVRTVRNYLVAYELAGSYPLRSVEAAWDKILGASTHLGLAGDFSSGFTPPDGLTWRRQYADGQPASLTGSVEHMTSAEGGAPLLAVNDYLLSGNLAGMELVPLSESVTVQGQFFLDGGVMKLQVETWQSGASLEFLSGSLETNEGQIYLLTDDGRRLELPDFPAEFLASAAEKGEFYISGRVDNQLLEWDRAYTGPMGGGGGGGGGLATLAKLNLSGIPAPTATPPGIPTPLVAEAVKGIALDGVSGSLYVVIYEQKDGQQITRASLQLDEPINDIYTVSLLDGPNLEGIQAYHLLPVRVWGTVSGLDSFNMPEVSVDRYEPVYPGMQSQILVGTEEFAAIEGKEVRLFTTEEGDTYVIRSSLDDAGEIPPGKWIYIQGPVLPDQTFGGYPVLDNFTEFPTDEKLEQEQITNIFRLTPDVILVEEMPSIPGGAAIERIELVYLAKDLGGAPETAGPNYLQPAWSFSGHYTDGTPFELYVQALTDDYLLPEPDDQ